MMLVQFFSLISSYGSYEHECDNWQDVERWLRVLLCCEQFWALGLVTMEGAMQLCKYNDGGRKGGD